MFPEVICADVTKKTNAEKRPLWVVCGLNGNKESFPAMWAFLPNESRWIFDWLVGKAIPSLLGVDCLRRNVLVLTDEDIREFGAFEDRMGPGKLLPNSKLRLCAWHKLNRNLTNLIRVQSLDSNRRRAQEADRVSNAGQMALVHDHLCRRCARRGNHVQVAGCLS